MTTITNDRSAGFNAQFSEDGSTVIYRKSEYKGKLRYSSLNSVNLQTGKTEQLVKPTRNLEGVTVKGGTVLAVNNGKLISKRIAGKKLKNLPAIPSIKNSQLYITIDGKTKQLSPNGTNVGYLWPSGFSRWGENFSIMSLTSRSIRLQYRWNKSGFFGDIACTGLVR